MLSKSGARSFFWIGTSLCALAFLLLTYLSLRSIPLRTHIKNMDESVVRGKKIWERKNCMGCHTLLGEGAYYAPELTQVTSRRSDIWLKQFLKNPEQMYPGQRKMTNFHLTDVQIEDVINFLRWVGNIDTNGFPLEIQKSLTGNVAVSVKANDAAESMPQPEKLAICLGCHQLAGVGGTAGPSFDSLKFGEGRLTKEYVQSWLKDPQSIKPDTAMPNLGLSDGDVEELTGFLFRESK